MPINTDAPGGFVPRAALNFAALDGSAVAVTPDDPMPMRERSYRRATPFVAGVDQSPGRAVAIVATRGGNVALRLASDTVLTVPVAAGLTILPFEAKTIVAGETTAVAAVSNLD